MHDVYAAARDVAGNTTSVSHLQVKVDTSSPTLSLDTVEALPASGWFTTEPTVEATASDAASGLDRVHCSVDPATAPSAYDDMGACDASYLLGDGVHDVYAAARDDAGNTTSVSHLQVKVDTTGPLLTVGLEPSSVVRGNPVMVVPDASDGLSGVDGTDCGEAPTDELGTFEVTCTAHDLAGNATEATASYDVLPADVSASVSAEKAPGTQLAVTALVTSDGAVDDATLHLTLPPSLRVDGLPAGCDTSDTGISCALPTIDAGGLASTTFLVSPRGPGPHAVDVLASAPLDRTDDGNEAFVSITSATVCDNTATSGDDQVVGTANDDILCGLRGNDTFRGLGGDDLIFGGPGNDTVSYAGATATRVDLGSEGLGLVGAKPLAGVGQGVDAFTGIENATGGSQADVLLGNGGRNVLRGGAGKDLLKGLAGSDRLIGGSGHDALYGGGGIDTCRTRADDLVGCER